MTTTTKPHPHVPPVENASIEDRLYTVKYRDSGESHLGVLDPEVCTDSCETFECMYVCPAAVWEVEPGELPTINYENCLECGSCRFACPYANVEWSYPKTGSRVSFKQG